MARFYVDLGFDTVIATPHFKKSFYTVTAEQVTSAVAALNDFLKNQNISLRVLPGNEVHFHSVFQENDTLENFHLLGSATRILLLELPSMEIPFESVLNLIYKLNSLDYDIILAHPERSVGLRNKKKHYGELIDRGIKFQINLPSLTGFYGRNAQKAAEYLLKEDMVFGLGTDAHNPDQLQAIIPKSLALLKKRIGEKKIHQLTTNVRDRLVTGVT